MYYTSREVYSTELHRLAREALLERFGKSSGAWWPRDPVNQTHYISPILLLTLTLKLKTKMLNIVL